MKRPLLLTTILCLLAASNLFARPQRREVVMDTVVNAPLETMLHSVERFYRQFQSCPDSLFTWAYIGIDEIDKKNAGSKPTKESKNAIQLIYKDRTYDPVLKVGDVAIDVYVLGVRWWKDQHLGTIYTLSTPEDSAFPITAQLTADYTGSIIEGGDFVFVLEPIDATRTRVHYEFSLGFGKTLSLFISDKIWQNAIEWRFVIILNNLVEYAETGTVVRKSAQ